MRTNAEPSVELLWWRGCPSWERALAELRAVVAGCGLDPESVDVREVATDAEAAEQDFVGSPTILVDGRDAQPPGDAPAGLTCRVYRLRDGRYSPTPDPADLRAAIERARTGRSRT